ncbi:MAG TPA: lactonase family protein [Chloroflexota bacterium]|nr:lactonase family protein [Chloroflexota bacterium]
MAKFLAYRLTRRRVLPLLGVAAAVGPVARALASHTPSDAAELQASQSGNLAGNPSGSFVFYQISRPSGGAVTLTLTYSPFEGGWGKAIGFDAWQGGNKLAGVTTDGATSGSASATITPGAGGGAVLIQLVNYSPRTISYMLAASGLAAAPAAGAAPAPAAAPAPGPAPAGARYVYVGTYTKPNRAPGGLAPSEALGVYVFRMDPATGGLTQVQLVTDTPNPSFLAIDPQMKYLYATNEVSTWKGKQDDGGVTAYAIEPSTGRLSLLNDQSSAGSIPASSLVAPSGRHLLVDNYVGATFAVLPIGADGKLSPATDVHRITGKGPNKARQEAPHPHDIKIDPSGKWALGPDLGVDRVFIWRWDAAAGKLVDNDPPFAQVSSGAGPRHLSYHPTGKFVYVINELDSTISAFGLDGATGALQILQTVPTLPADFTGNSSCAEVIVHPSGKFVYGSNRGHDSLVIYAINQANGRLSLVGWESTQGKVPRNFGIDPSGTLLLAANQNSDTIVPFRIDQNTGKLTATGAVTSTPTPVCVLFGRTI